MSEERQPFDAPPPEPPVPSEPAVQKPASTPPGPPPMPEQAVPPPPPPSERPRSAPPPLPSNIRPLPQRPVRPALSSGDWRRRGEDLLSQLGIDAALAGRTLAFAIIAAVIGALLDEILGLPGVSLRVSFGGTLVAGLSGLSYAYFKGREDAPGLIMAAFAGMVAYLVWYLVTEIVSDAFLNVPKAMVSGAFAGLIGFGWLALLHEIPKRLGRVR